MTEKTITKKIPGGKLVRIDLSFEEVITDVKITGDFFLHPEDVLEKLEKEIIGLYVPLNKPSLINRLDRVIENNSAELIGVSTIDIVNALTEVTQ